MEKRKKIVLIFVGLFITIGLIAAALVGGVIVGYTRGEEVAEMENDELNYDPNDIEGVWIERIDGQVNNSSYITRFTVQEDKTILEEGSTLQELVGGSVNVDDINWSKRGVIDSAFYNDLFRVIPFHYTPQGYNDNAYNSFFTIGLDFNYMTKSYTDHIDGADKKVYYVRLPIKNGKPFYDKKEGEENSEYFERHTKLVLP